MAQKFNALVRPSVLEDFNDEMNPLRLMLLDHFSTVSDQPEEESVQAIIKTNILRDYGEALVVGLRRHLHESAGFLLTSMEFEGFEPTPNDEDAYSLKVSLHKGDVSLLDYFVIDEDLDLAIQKNIINDQSGIYQDCPTEISDWRLKSPVQRTPEERGMILNSASEHSWDQNIDFSMLKNKIAELKPQLNPLNRQQNREADALSLS